MDKSIQKNRLGISIVKYSLVLVIVSGTIGWAAPTKANAQATAGIASCSAASFIGQKIASAISGLIPGLNVPTNDTQNNTKESLLDALAYCAAQQILHQMTVATVNWINSGFEGSPAYLTDPEAFFLDAADQMTGAFIASNGPLSSLCSPWSVDVRLTLALDMYINTSNRGNLRYGCTLNTIIGNAENSSINGFIQGDFSQGGWPAFIAMNTDPRNNPFGSYLMARDDLQRQIAAANAEVNRDLDRGRGFMSWEKCTNVEVIDPSGTGATRTERRCSRETPGSVIANTLEKQLNIPAERLNLADELNEVANALATQLAMQVFGGLRSLSPGGASYGSGGTPYLSQIQAEVNAEATASSRAQYDQAIALITASRSRLITAQTCIANKVASATVGETAEVIEARDAMTAIDTTINNQVSPLLAGLTNSRNFPSTTLQASQTLNNASTQASQFDEQASAYQYYCETLSLGGTDPSNP